MALGTSILLQAARTAYRRYGMKGLLGVAAVAGLGYAMRRRRRRARETVQAGGNEVRQRL